MRYLRRGGDGDRGGRRTGCGGEVFYEGGRCVHGGGVHGWSVVRVLGLIDLVVWNAIF